MTSRRPARRQLPRRVLIGAVLLAGVGALVLGILGATVGRSAASASSIPFNDPSATGYIGLCNHSGQQITSGILTARPFAWRAVSSVPAEAPYNGASRTAILLAYQPRQGLPASAWSGSELTASSRYSNAHHPMVAATAADDSLADFTSDFHPVWNGYVQLRIYLGAAGQEVFRLHYPSLVVQVSGSRWHAVGGGKVDCHGGTAESIESIVLPESATSPSSTTASTGGTSSPGSGGQPGSGHSTGGHNDSSSRTSSAAAGVSAGSSDLTASTAGAGSAVPWIVLAASGLLLAAGSATLLRRRAAPRRATTPTTVRRSPKKGH